VLLSNSIATSTFMENGNTSGNNLQNFYVVLKLKNNIECYQNNPFAQINFEDWVLLLI
jgi:hypothetical protein